MRSPAAADAAELPPSDARYEIEFQVPDDLFSLGVELGDAEAAAVHAEFLDARLTDDAPGELREQALAQLDAARRDLIEQRVRYLALASGEVDDHWSVCLFGVSLTELASAPEFDPGSMLAGVLGHRYSENEALVEQFDTEFGPAVGVRRTDLLAVPNTDPPEYIDTGAAEVMVLFPELGVVGVVSGYCLDVQDIDLTAVLVGGIAHTLNITSPTA